MKTLRLTFLFILPVALLAGAVKRGDRIESVRSALGTPKGQMQAGEREVFIFDRGTVELTSGLVTRVALRSESEQVAYEAAAAHAREVQSQSRTQQIAEGEALKARMLADHSFQTSPLSYQINFWQNFSTRYAAVPCTLELTIVRAKLNEQAETSRVQEEQAQRIAELAARAREAEARAAYAQNSRSYYSPYRTLYGDNSYGDNSFYRDSPRYHSFSTNRDRAHNQPADCDRTAGFRNNPSPKITAADQTRPNSPWENNDTWLGIARSPTDSSRF